MTTHHATLGHESVPASVAAKAHRHLMACAGAAVASGARKVTIESYAECHPFVSIETGAFYSDRPVPAPIGDEGVKSAQEALLHVIDVGARYGCHTTLGVTIVWDDVEESWSVLTNVSFAHDAVYPEIDVLMGDQDDLRSMSMGVLHALCQGPQIALAVAKHAA